MSIDGGSETSVDLYTSFALGSGVVYSSPTLANGPHTFKIRTTGFKNPSSSGITVMVDRVDIAKASYTYGYDAVGNLTSNNGVAQRYDADNQLTAVGAITYTYDNNGNQTATSESTLPRWTYDAQNHTISYNDSVSSDTFVVDGGLQRRQKVTVAGGSTTSGVFDGDLYRQTQPTARTLSYVRDPSGRLLALTDGTTVYYYGLDGHGSVANLTDSGGNVVNSYRYDPYGNSLGKTETASLPNPWQYAGGYYDAESGLYLLGARYYAPQLGRFLQQDPLGGDSQYAYAGSDPCNNSDPSGMLTCYHHITPDQILNQSDALSDDAAKGNDDSTTTGAAGGLGGLLGSVPGAVIGIIVAAAQLIIANHENAAAAFLSTHSGATYGVYVQYQVNDAYHGGTKLISHCASGDINGDTTYGPYPGPIMTGDAADGYFSYFGGDSFEDTHSWP